MGHRDALAHAYEVLGLHGQFSMRDLDDIAHRINTRPRRLLDWATSAELSWPRVRAGTSHKPIRVRAGFPASRLSGRLFEWSQIAGTPHHPQCRVLRRA